MSLLDFAAFWTPIARVASNGVDTEFVDITDIAVVVVVVFIAFIDVLALLAAAFKTGLAYASVAALVVVAVGICVTVMTISVAFIDVATVNTVALVSCDTVAFVTAWFVIAARVLTAIVTILVALIDVLAVRVSAVVVTFEATLADTVVATVTVVAVGVNVASIFICLTFVDIDTAVIAFIVWSMISVRTESFTETTVTSAVVVADADLVDAAFMIACFTWTDNDAISPITFISNITSAVIAASIVLTSSLGMTVVDTSFTFVDVRAFPFEI